MNGFSIDREISDIRAITEELRDLADKRAAQPDAWACMARFGSCGDNLICSSVLPGLKARYGHVEVITRSPAGVVFENNPYIDKLTMWPEKEDPEGSKHDRIQFQHGTGNITKTSG